MALNKTSRHRRKRIKRTGKNRQRGGAGEGATSGSAEEKSAEEKPKEGGNIFQRAFQKVGDIAAGANASMRSFVTANQKANDGKEDAGAESTSESTSAESKSEGEKPKTNASSFFSLPSFLSGSPASANNSSSIKDDINNLIERLGKEKDQLIHNREENEEAIRNLIMAIMGVLKELEASNKVIQDKLNSIAAQEAAVGASVSGADGVTAALGAGAAALGEGAAALGASATQGLGEAFGESEDKTSSDLSKESDSVDSASLENEGLFKEEAKPPTLFGNSESGSQDFSSSDEGASELATPAVAAEPTLASPAPAQAAASDEVSSDFGSSGSEDFASASASEATPAAEEANPAAEENPVAEATPTFATPPEAPAEAPPFNPLATPTVSAAPTVTGGGKKRRTRRRRSRRSSRR